MILLGDWCPQIYTVDLELPENVYLANLEAPILPQNHTCQAINKAGPSLSSYALPEAKSQFIFSLANNHTMDYGLSGLENCLVSLQKKNIRACGAGNDIFEARQPVIIEDNGIRIGIISACEAQFGVARHNQPGVAEFGTWIYEAIDKLHNVVDHVIVSVHAGIEESPWPVPYLRDLYRSYIDAGATVVHGHHAHIPQGFESYKEGLIFYGMGNFAVNPDKWCNYPNGMWSLGAEINFNHRPLTYKILTFEIRYQEQSKSILVELSTLAEHQKHLDYIEICNLPFQESSLFYGLWQEVALRAYYNHAGNYMGFLNSPSKGEKQTIRYYLSRLKSKIFKGNTSQWKYLLWYHMFACESHRQGLVTALGVLSGEIHDLRTEETRKIADKMMPWSVGIVPL
jgi:hypothetical protein